MPFAVSRALCITLIRFGSLLLVFGTISYLALISSHAAHKKPSFKEKLMNASKCDSKIRGVNLGGWLVLEPWITPSIFEEVNVGPLHGAILDEYTYFQNIPHEKALQRLEK